MKELLVGTGLLVYGVVIFVLLGILAVGLVLAISPWFQNQEREITQHTNMYVQSKVTELVDSYTAYFELEVKKLSFSDPEVQKGLTAQQVALVRRMCNTYHLIPDDVDDVPDYILTFLKEQNCG